MNAGEEGPGRRSITTDLLKGAVAGAAGWRVMDPAIQFLYNHEGPSVREAEDAARGRVPALEVLAEKIAARAGLSLSLAQREKAGTALQWATVIVTGMAYGALRDRAPAVGAGHGLAFGAGVALLVDEGMVPLLGLSPGPGAFPWQTHARSLVGHLIFGFAADAALDLLDRVVRH